LATPVDWIGGEKHWNPKIFFFFKKKQKRKKQKKPDVAKRTRYLTRPWKYEPGQNARHD